ncbi:MAG: tRNA lysidine(34) synthetase TilS, partial [Firmicutes bacterium]|nr:tRNA lysidine(34) synthetase TilS [Bacillota bacterium]
LIEKGDKVGVGVSGGEDSMALLHFLDSLREPFGIQVVAVNVNHNIRPNSRKDTAFVSKFCKDNNILYASYNVDVPSYAKQKRIGIEQAARIKRYEAFGQAAKRFKLTKFAVAHHQSDQAETILLHILRGSGISGARGMDITRSFLKYDGQELGGTHVSDCPLVRPFLETKKTDIVAYNYRNQVPSICDESNADCQFARNFLRQQVIPLLQREWRNVEKNIVDFGKNCRNDDEYLNSIVNLGALIHDENHVRVPLNFFAHSYPVISRILLSAFEKLDERQDIEKKHIDIVMTLAQSGENGSRVDLPNSLYAVKEYEYIAIVRRVQATAVREFSFRIGHVVFPNWGTIITTKTISHKDAVARGLMVMDVDKLPRQSKWRTRKDGDVFTKFGGGTNTLNKYLIDKKIPARLRDKLPVLAHGKEVYAIAGIEISETVRTDRETLDAYVVEFIKD